MRRVYIVTYDICDQKRWRQVFKTMKGFGQHLQLSVFRCALSRMDYVKMTSKLSDVIKHDEDQVILIDLGAVGDKPIKSVQAMGKPLLEPSTGSQIV